MSENAPNQDARKSKVTQNSLTENWRWRTLIWTCLIFTSGITALYLGSVKYVNRKSNEIYENNFPNRSFLIDTSIEMFVKDGNPFQFISGSIHYFRIQPIYWFDRLFKAKSLGLDTIQIDIPWNFHARERGKFTFDGQANLEQFLLMAEQQDLLVIARIGPYIGCDWSLGGLPPWLLREYPNIRMRTSAPEFINAVQQWFDVLLPKLKKHMYNAGGPIIIIQIENEYGSYAACDRNYIGALTTMVRHHLGSDVVISTADVGTTKNLKCGSPFAVNLATVNFGAYKGDPDDKFGSLFKLQPGTPWVNSEYFTGWMDHWGYSHFFVQPRTYIGKLLELLNYSPRISVNIYMVHGGTNFGLWNGASKKPYSSHITSYDHNAPLSEAGDITDFYLELRNALFAFKNISAPELPTNTTKLAYTTVPLYLVSHLLAQTSTGVNSLVPMSMEAISQFSGFLLYRTQFYRNPGDTVRLKFKELSDYAYIFTASVNLEQLAFHGAVSRDDRSLVFQFESKYNTTDLLILVENAGYVTYATRSFNDHKGILGPVSADGRELLGWNMLPVCLTRDSHYSCNHSLHDRIARNIHRKTNKNFKSPTVWPISGSIFAGVLNIPSADLLADTFVHPQNFTRGLLLVNGEILGRYNQALGPQLRLFVPKNFLHIGENTFVAIELDSLWLNQTMNGEPNPEGTSFPLLFDTEMHWLNKKILPVQ